MVDRLSEPAKAGTTHNGDLGLREPFRQFQAQVLDRFLSTLIRGYRHLVVCVGQSVGQVMDGMVDRRKVVQNLQHCLQKTFVMTDIGEAASGGARRVLARS